MSPRQRRHRAGEGVDSLPGVSVLSELNLPGYEMQSWQGVFAPVCTPAAVVERLSRELAAIVREPDVQTAIRIFANPASRPIESAVRLALTTGCIRSAGSQCRGAVRTGPDSDNQGKARLAVLRHQWQWHLAAPDNRDVSQRHRLDCAACALQRQQRVADQRGRRPDRHAVRHHGDGTVFHQVRQGSWPRRALPRGQNKNSASRAL